ncbi:uncharacterized protein LOC133723353 isoform X2 [Rosa rugosa]|uniref:uncharacterized protein LOC133723353 isoform X2 n=1 Tax=Rosa rugosa TaxID=74645 RepID=UPI002B40E3D0|nr:uncharacterized protein LOC133723353 isoform X2 [Rosa rugosa]
MGWAGLEAAMGGAVLSVASRDCRCCCKVVMQELGGAAVRAGGWWPGLGWRPVVCCRPVYCRRQGWEGSGLGCRLLRRLQEEGKAELSDDERLFYLGICTPADLNNNNKETGSDSGLSLEKLSLQPRKKLLVLSLNGLLLYRVYRFSQLLEILMPDLQVNWFSEDLLLQSLWNSALNDLKWRRKVKGVLNRVMGRRQRKKLLVIFAQDDCTYSGSMSMEDKEKPLFLKELKDLWKYLDGKYSESDTLLIDDQPYKALLNPPYIGIFLESYNPDNAGDNALGELGVYLDDLAAADNVQVYVKKNPFGVPAISSGHPDWNLYSDVIRRLKGESEKASCIQDKGVSPKH